MGIIAQALEMNEVVENFVKKARGFFYSVVLLGHHCPKCSGSLTMLSEGKCGCKSCGARFDPTVAFQQCSTCGGIPSRRVRRYQCRNCGGDVRSAFLFDGLVFDGEYFRQKMAECRQRRKELREHVRQMLAESRSGILPLDQADPSVMPGLMEALNSLTVDIDGVYGVVSRDRFDLKQYERHIEAHTHDLPLSLTDIPALNQDARKDLAWRFVAAVFLAHAGAVRIWQEGHNVMVMKHETDRERQDISGEPEEPDGVEGPVGRAEAY